MKARDGAGAVGYVPENYLEFPPVSTHSHHYAVPPGEDAPSAFDTASISTSGTSSLTVASSTSGYDKEVTGINSKTNSYRGSKFGLVCYNIVNTINKGKNSLRRINKVAVILKTERFDDMNSTVIISCVSKAVQS